MPAKKTLNSNEKYLTLTTAADILDVNIATVRRWTNSSKLKSVRTPGGHRRILKKDIEKILLKKKRKHESAQLKSKTAQVVIPVVTPVVPSVVVAQQPTTTSQQSINTQPTIPATSTTTEKQRFPEPPKLFDLDAQLHPKQTKVFRRFLTTSFVLAAILISVTTLKAFSSTTAYQTLYNNLPVLGSVLPTPSKLANIQDKRTAGRVLQAADTNEDIILRINVPVNINNDATISGNLTINGDLITQGATDLLTGLEGVTADQLNYLGGVELTSGGVVYSTDEDLQVTVAGTSNQVLVSQGTSAPIWKTVTDLFTLPDEDASTLDGIDSTSFLRSDASDAYTSGTLTFESGTTLTLASADLILSGTSTFNIGGSGSDVAYNVIGDSTTTASSGVDSDDDLYIEGNLEVDGEIIGSLSGGLTTTLDPGSVTFIGSSQELTGDSANFFWDNDTNELGIGTNSPSYNLHVAGTAGILGNFTLGDNAASDTLTMTSRIAGHLIPTVASTYDLGDNTRTWRTLYVDEIVADNITTSGTNLNGTTANDFAINTDNATVDTENATLTFDRGTESVNAEWRWDATNKWLSTNVPSVVIDWDPGITASGKSALIVNQDQSQDIFTASASGTTRFTVGNAGNTTIRSDNASAFSITDGTSTYLTLDSTTDAADTLLTLTGTGGSITSGNIFSLIGDTITTGNVQNISADGLTTGNGIYVESTSTALSSGNLASLYWNPGSSTTATGDLMRLNVGANGTIGNIFNVLNNSSSVFSVSQSQITANLPVQFNSPGDVAIAYDLNFTNQTASYIKSNAPLYIEAGESFENNDLTLRTFGTGNVVADLGSTGEFQLVGADTSIIFDTETATDTDFWAGIVDDGGSDDDDYFAIGDGTTPGTNPFLAIETSGEVGIGITAPTAYLHLVSSGTSNKTLLVNGDAYTSQTDAAAVFHSAGDSVLISTNENSGAYAPLEIKNLAGSTPGGGTTIFRVGADGAVGINDGTPDAKLNILSTTEQLRLDYDDSNYTSFTVSSSGGLTVTPIGTMSLNSTGDMTLDSSTDIILDADGADIILKDAGTTFATFTNSTTDLTLDVVGSNFILADGDALNVGGIGAVAYNAFAGSGEAADNGAIAADNDLYVGGDFEVDGTTIDFASATSLTCSDCIDFDDFEDTMDLDAALTLNQGSNAWSQTYTGTTTTGYSYTADSVTTANAMSYSFDGLTTGNGIYVESTSTALSSGNLASLYWNPGSSTTATGDLMRLNVGANGTIGNIFNVLNNSSSVFSVSQSQITAALPTQFTAAGDVSVAYDLNFTNQTAAYIKSLGPLDIQAGESFENNDLTLRTYGTGNVTFDITGTGKVSVGSSTNPLGLLTVDSTNTTTYGKALAIFNHDETQDLITASASGVTEFAIASDGIVYIGNNTTLGTSTALCWESKTRNGATVYQVGDCTGTPADYAEMYPTEEGISYGDIVSLGNQNVTQKDGQVVKKLAKSSTAYDTKTIGIVSNNYHDFTLAGTEAIKEEDRPMPVALSGRVPVKVSPNSPAIEPGDFVTSSTDAGKAIKATSSGYVIGKALESWTPNSGKETVMVFVNNTYSIGSLTEQGAVVADFSSTSATTEEAIQNEIAKEQESTQAAALKQDIEVLKSEIEDLKTNLNLLSDLVALNATTSAILGETTIATDSAVFDLSSSEATISSLMITDKLLTNDLGITGSLTAGLLSINGLNGDIHTLSGPLRLQSSPLASLTGGIEFLNGALEIDTKGNLAINQGVIKGNDTFRGTAILPAKTTKITINQEWETAPSSINLTPSFLTVAAVTSITKDGFTIEVLSSSIKQEKIYWLAIW